jgi:pilus assembly protein Flp/PilA
MTVYVALRCGLLALPGKLADRERGATAVEYGLLVAFIAAAVVAAVAALGVKVNLLFIATKNAVP